MPLTWSFRWQQCDWDWREQFWPQLCKKEIGTWAFTNMAGMGFEFCFPLNIYSLPSSSQVLITVIFILMFLRNFSRFFLKWFVLIWMYQDHGNAISVTQWLQCFQTQSRYQNTVTGLSVWFYFFQPLCCRTIYFLIMCFSLYTALYFWYNHSYEEPEALWTCLVSQFSWCDCWISLMCSVTQNVWWKSRVLFLCWQ